jgi:LysM repeat protein
MRRNVLRLSGWGGMVILLAVLLIAGCTRSKSSGPSDATAVGTAAAAAPTQSTGVGLTPTPSGDEAISATANAMAATATAQAALPTSATDSPLSTEAAPTEAAPTEAEPTEAAPTDTPAVTEPTATTAPAEAGTSKTHTVQAGDNLFRIALKYGLTYQAVAAYNGIANPNFIVVGQAIKIPAAGAGETPPAGDGGTHMVQLGENLFRIALKYNMAYTTLAAANNLNYPYTIYPGQKLVIP